MTYHKYWPPALKLLSRVPEIEAKLLLLGWEQDRYTNLWGIAQQDGPNSFYSAHAMSLPNAAKAAGILTQAQRDALTEIMYEQSKQR